MPAGDFDYEAGAIRRFWLNEYVPEMLAAEASRYPAVAGELTPVPIPLGCHDAGIKRLRADLKSGAWDARRGHLRTQPGFDGSLRLVVVG